MNNYVEEFSFEEKPRNYIKIVKIILIMIMTFVLGTIIIKGCSRIFDDNGVLDKNGLREEKKYDMDKPFKELGIYSQDELDDYLYEVSKYLKPKEFQNLIDWSDYKYRFNENWDAYENGWQVLEQKFEWATHDELIRRVVHKGNDWSILPLSERFRKKFNGVNVPKYYGYTDDRITHIYYDSFNDETYKSIPINIFANGTKFSLEEYTGNGEEMNYIYFKSYFNDEGYLDDIEFSYAVPMYDSNGNYVTEKDLYLMNKERSIATVLKYILPIKSYNYFEGNAGYNPYSSPIFYENVVKEIGMTDNFRLYYESLKGIGILPDKIYRSGHYSDENIYDKLEIENINIDNKSAVAKVTLGEQKVIKYYDISWTIDDEYRIDSIKMELHRIEATQKSSDNTK